MLLKIKAGGSFFITLFFVVIALIFSTIVITGGDNVSGKNYSRNGILDISEFNLNKNILLDGEWKFYDQKFISDADEFSDSYEIVDVPHTWNETGFASYSLRIKGLKPGKDYCFYIPDNISAYRFFINSNPAAENGRVGKDFKSEMLHWEPHVVYFTAEEEYADIMLHISNFHILPGGFIRVLKLGLPGNIISEKMKNLSIQMVLLGGLLIISLYSFSLFLLNANDKAALYFSLFNLVVAVRILMTGDRIINQLITDLNWSILLKVQFVTGAFMLGLFILFMKTLFRSLFNRFFDNIFLGFFVLFVILPLIVPPELLAFLDMLFFAVSLTYFLYLMCVLIKAVRSDIQGALFAFMGISFIVVTIVLDLISPPGSNVIPLGLFIFVIFQSLVIAEKHNFVIEQNVILHNAAMRDSMTKLYKKEYFYKMINSIIEEETPVINHALMFIDIDNFKSINDSYGHEAGDEIIISIAGNIVHSMRYSDIACRYGGDEFMLWLHNTSVEDSRMIAERILKNISQPIEYNESTICISASIGISYFTEDGDCVDKLFAVCDQRMYKAKDKGKNQYCIS